MKLIAETMNIETILKDLYSEIEMPLQILRKYELETVLNNSIREIKKQLNESPSNFSAFRDIASSILVSINGILRHIEDPLEKSYLEILLKDIAVYLLENAESNVSNPEKFVAEIISSLQTASSIHGYNFEALVALLKLNKAGHLKLIFQNSGKQYHYEWMGSKADLDELLATMLSEQWINSIKDFRKIFSDHRVDNLGIKFSRLKLKELIVLFDLLKEKDLIRPKGGKGHFHPLKVHLVDLEKDILFTRDPKVVKMIAKRNEEKWASAVKIIEKWLEGFKQKVTLR
jgi:hypothetical protein